MSAVRCGWKTWVLVIATLAMLWILVAPQVDLDPATPLNLDAFFFAVLAISILLYVGAFLHAGEGKRLAGVLPHSCAPPVMLISQVAPLRC